MVCGEECSPAFDVWCTNIDLSIKSTWSQERWIKNVNAIRGSQDDDICLLSETYNNQREMITTDHGNSYSLPG